ncbi:MAG: hypothetical protein JKY01_11895 [Pseudomonadales bacterium]|nr:hypothetical protein [Pseudomonadales bacterium]
MTKDLKPKANASNQANVTRFLAKVEKNKAILTAKKGEHGKPCRLIFAMDATASRQPMWDKACHLQVEMFNATVMQQNLRVQICYYRGYQEFSASHWLHNSEAVREKMCSVSCLGGHTQIYKVLEHALLEHKNHKVQAVVFVGDALEESIDDLCHLAGKAGILKIPVFIFQEGKDPRVRQGFQQIARLSGGAYAAFDVSSAKELGALLGAAAAYASGGKKALEQFSLQHSGKVKQLAQQII